MLVFLSQKQLMEFGHVDLCFLVVADLFNFSESYSSLKYSKNHFIPSWNMLFTHSSQF